jgi:hypothetical protein
MTSHHLSPHCNDHPAPAPGDPAASPAGQTPPTVRVASPGDLLAVVPYLLGFHPEHSIVVVGTRPPRNRVQVAFRYDLPDPPDPACGRAIAEHAASVLARQHITAAVIAGYGPGTLVTPVVQELRTQMADAGVELADMLRAENGRYWSYVCQDPGCCPPDGVPFGEATTAAETAVVASGMTALAGREDLAATIAPEAGPARAAMRQATASAQHWAAELTRDPSTARTQVTTSGCQLARAALAAYRDGGRLSDTDAARLSVLLSDLRVRDEAWALIDPADTGPHLALWTDMTSRAVTGVAACASLLAFAAWTAGNGALANIALARALDADSGYRMAHLIIQALQAGMPPLTEPVMTPGELAALGETPAQPG